MKRWVAFSCVLLLAASLLCACGGKQDQSAEVYADLAEFYAGVEAEYGWDNGYMADIEGELLEGYYPGLSEIPAKQLIVKAPMMSAVVNELVFMQCESEADAEAAEAILQERVKMQAEGGAWYPESMEAWSRAAVVRQGDYVCMVASAEYQDEIVQGFNDLFL